MNTKEEKIKNIFNLYSDEVYKVCLHITKNEQNAKEILTEVFVQVYFRMEKLEEDRGWDLISKNKSDLVRSYLIVYASMLAKGRR